MNLLTAYFKRELVSAGFPDDLQVEWSLSYCQGDGMAFYGDLSFDDLVTLSPKIYATNKCKQRMFARLVQSVQSWDYNESFEIRRTGMGYRYSHYNTMALTITASEGLRFFDEFFGKEDWYFPQAKKGCYMALWDEFVEDLESHIRDTSRELERQGYRILDAIPNSPEQVYCFDTENYRIEMVSLPADLNWIDEEEGKWLCQKILTEQCRFSDLEVFIKDKETGITLGQQACYGTVYAEKDRTFDGQRFQLIREAIEQARSPQGLVARQSTLMQKQLNA